MFNKTVYKLRRDDTIQLTLNIVFDVSALKS